MTKKIGVVRTVNITRLFRTATDEQVASGIRWYELAHETAEALAEIGSTTVSIAAGVIAAVSPRIAWEQNITLATKILTVPGFDATMKVPLAKAHRIMDGEDPVLVLHAPKTTNFYRSIISLGQDGVCIDRHAWDVATGIRHSDDTRPAIAGSRYVAAADAYRRAAAILSAERGAQRVTPAQVQSTTWELWRNRYGGTRISH